MCDYSLQLVVSRPAMVGDELVSTKFTNAITGGFAAVGEPDVAVCLLPGTEVAFEKEVEYDHFYGDFRNRKVGAAVAKFRRVDQKRALTASSSGSACGCWACSCSASSGR